MLPEITTTATGRNARAQVRAGFEPASGAFFQCSHRSYIQGMRAAGVREVRNKLSEYLRLVAEGETVLAAAGKVKLPRQKVPSPGAGPVPGVPGEVDLARILDDVGFAAALNLS